jgi:hypothetical protein
MTTKRTKITKRVISKILGRRVEGWNDKTMYTNRIKLTEVLTYREMSMLESELTFMFPEYRFAIGNICWRPQQRYRRIATAITFWK